jgi:hypothetical protein
MKTFCIRAVAAAGLGLVGIIPLRSAHADPSVADKSIATQLFKEGRALLDQGHVAQACRKLEESQRIEPGGGTLLNVALCHEREGRTATAWAEFTEAIGIAKRDDRPQRVEFARAHLALLEPELSRLSIQVPGAADQPDLEIKRDGSILGRAAWGSPIPVDPGDHLVEVVAPGKIPWKQTILLAPNADTRTLVVPVLENAPVQESVESPPSAPTSRVAPVPLANPGNATQDKVVEGSSGGSTVPAWIALTLGVAAAGAGTYFALLAVSQKSDADRNCPNDACSAEGVRQNSDAIKSANFATTGLGVGVAGVVLGTVLFATRSGAPRAAESAAKSSSAHVAVAAGDLSLGPAGARLAISGHW